MKAMTKASASSTANRSQAGASAMAQISGAVRLEGVVEHGDARGRELGYPTANITVPDGEVRDGVWAGTVRLGPGGQDGTYAAAVSVGRRPTYYSKGTRLLEAYLLDYSGDLYGRSLQVALHAYIRPQRRFHGTKELAAQIRDDVACVRSWVEVSRSGSLDMRDQARETEDAKGNHWTVAASGTPHSRPPAKPEPASARHAGPT